LATNQEIYRKYLEVKEPQKNSFVLLRYCNPFLDRSLNVSCPEIDLWRWFPGCACSLL